MSAAGAQVTDVDFTNPVASALWLTGRGMFVFPCDHPNLEVCAGIQTKEHNPTTCTDRGKHPVVKWSTVATTDPKQIDAWFNGSPRNIGVACKPSKLFVPDEDVAGGLARFAADQGHALPDSLAVRTGRGKHLYLADETGKLGNSAGPLKAYGVDVRGGGTGAGGYVVGPGSLHASGVLYEPYDADASVLAVPGWLAQAITEKRQHGNEFRSNGTSNGNGTGTGFQPGTIPYGARDDQLFRFASWLRGEGYDIAEAKARMQRRWQDCEQPAGDFYPLDAALAKVDAVYSTYAPGNGRGTQTRSGHGRAGPAAAPPAPPAPEDPEALPALLGELIDTLRSYQDLPDVQHVLAVLAAAATNALATDPCWLMVVAPASSGKTETVRLLDSVASARLDEVTCAGLLDWVRRGRTTIPGGALVALGQRGILTFGDLSGLLASSDKGGRDQVFSLLRRIYDGHAERHIATPAGAAPDARLVWDGRVSVVAACTSAIDEYSTHANALGPRWVYFRLDARDTGAKRRAATRARHGALPALRASARALASRIVAAASARIADTEVPDEVADAIEDAVLVTCWGRASVPRNGYGKREIDGLPEIEDPPRLIQQLHALARGLLALGLAEDEVTRLCRRCVLDSMPANRRAVLAVLSHGESDLNTARVAHAADLHRHVARRTLEELEVVGVVEGHRIGPEPAEYDDDKRPCTWELAGTDGKITADVFQAHRADRQKGGTKSRFTPPLLPQQREDR